MLLKTQVIALVPIRISKKPVGFAFENFFTVLFASRIAPEYVRRKQMHENNSDTRECRMRRPDGQYGAIPAIAARRKRWRFLCTMDILRQLLAIDWMKGY